jgi:RHS repeat-associated protein
MHSAALPQIYTGILQSTPENFETGDATESMSGFKYRFGFNGQEKDNEVMGEGNFQDYGFRMYNSRLGRFISVDPLLKDYPFYTPYQFAGNMPIKFIDLDGLEPAEYKMGAKHLVIINLGYAGEPSKGKTQSKNGKGDENGGLSSYFDVLSRRPDVQVVIFNSSFGDVTERDIVATIKNFETGVGNQSGSTISLVGHSLGADQFMETLEENNVSADMLVSLDLSGGILTNDNETVEKESKINLVLGFHSVGRSLGSNELDSNNPNCTVANIAVNGVQHTEMDNKLGSIASNLVNLKISGTTNDQLIKEANGSVKTLEKLKTAGAPAGTVPRID